MSYVHRVTLLALHELGKPLNAALNCKCDSRMLAQDPTKHALKVKCPSELDASEAPSKFPILTPKVLSQEVHVLLQLISPRRRNNWSLRLHSQESNTSANISFRE